MQIRRIAAAVAALTVFAGMAAVGLDRLPSRGLAEPSANGAPAPARVQRVAPLPASIDVVGKVVAHGGATTGTITVRVGTGTAQTTGTISPQFLATIAGVRASDMVTIEVVGSGFKYTSLLGTYGKLVRQAGADRVLTLEECDALRVSPISTALQFFIARRLGGPPASDAQLEDATRSLLSADLVGVSNMLSKLARGAVDLPNGFMHGYALLQNQQAYRSFVFDHPEAGYDPAEELAALPFNGFDAAEASRTIALVGAVADTGVPIVAPQAQVIERTATGYLLHASDFRRDSRFVGAFDAGALTFTPTGEIYYDTYRDLCQANGQQIVERTRLTGETHRIIRRGDRATLRLVLSNYDRYPLNCPDYPAYSYTLADFWTAIDLARVMPIANARRFHGLRSLPYFCVVAQTAGVPAYLQACEYALHRFDADGSGAALELGPKVDQAMRPVQAQGQSTFAWSIAAPGVMELDSATTTARYWTVDAGNGNVSGLVYVAEATVGGTPLSMAGYSPMLNGNNARGFGSLGPIGTWGSSSYDQYLEPYVYDEDNAAVISHVTRTADGTSVEHGHVPRYPEYDYQLTTTWELSGGRLFDTRVRANNSRRYRDCAAALADGATQCGPSLVRYFRPMARSGNRLYGIAESYSYLGSSYQPPFDFYRASRPAYQTME